MQGLDEMLGSSGMDLGSLGAKFGLSPEQTSAAMGSLMPAVLGGFQKKADASDLSPLQDTAAGIEQPDAAAGNDILGHIFGNKDVSRQVADHASGQSGVSSTILKAMLPVVAAMLAKHLANNAGNGGMLGSILGGSGGSGGLGGLGGLSSILGGESAGGNPLDQILARMR